ncbi:MAG: PolC-type DNA polymerase III, partial [Selenomonadaceae bacterium]|nr:PolC-type DNA polymerase III [Selenomonadaceae bacterium]
MDAIISPDKLIETAANWNWSAVAITDHGVIQAFPTAADTVEKLAKKGKKIKVIYGMEGYLTTEENQRYAFHVIILAKNKVGLGNLYRLVSISQLKYFYRKPRIPKDILAKFREGLIIGSACAQGELISAILDGKDDAELDEIAKFYDYLEIQPIHNNDFLKKSVQFPQINSDEDLRNINRRVADIAQKLDKPLIATCDAHFLNAEDSLYRAIMMSGKGFKHSDEQPPIFLRTTDEMLNEFTYLDKDTAYKAVVENPNMIADSIEELKPIPDGLYSPQMPGADAEIDTMARTKAKELYGDPLPKIVEERLNQELTPITKHGFSVLYLIAQKLVKKSNDDGYLVGSRGSVGSSFVAAMTGITEVNPLPPHYRCPKCQYSEFFTKGDPACGYDLPDKNCPVCGHPLTKDGHDIPFAVFLGFDGDKVPDIDLNFSGEYQAAAHKYTEILFGRHNVYRAGTISTIADKTAYGFAKKYYDELDAAENRKLARDGSFISYQANGFTGVKRTTGQHPAGIMVVPRDMDIHYFTPIQHPAEDKSSTTITTHFDYHSISSRLVKLDILGHDDPTVIKMLENITHINPLTIPLDDKPTLSLFSSTKAIGLKPAQLGTNSGTFGIPEFRTSFTRQMIDDTTPQCFSDLVRISGFSHGTDVWLGNAQDLIKAGTCRLQNAISARDDIMMYLIHNGVEALTAFKIMESVRKGKGIKPEQVEMLKEKGIPDWYIDACQKIKYLFPRAHATAYVMMAYRIAYCKVHYPMAYYAAYFSIRADEFDADEIVKGENAVKLQIERLENLSHERKLDVKETEKLAVLQVAYEMFLRGIGVKHVDLYKSDAEKFIVLEDEQKLLPPLSSLTGLGTVAARSIVDARKGGEFSSIEDLTRRAKINKTAVEVLKNHGSLDGMAETNQIMLFNF